jgi:hypothetical protein
MNARDAWRTWAEFGIAEPMDSPRLLTREELLTHLAGRGVRVTTNDLRNWQYTGAIPRGIPTGAVGQRKTRYPSAMVDLLVEFRALQAEGYRIEQIGRMLRRTGQDSRSVG